jgi:hypothetical protein
MLPINGKNGTILYLPKEHFGSNNNNNNIISKTKTITHPKNYYNIKITTTNNDNEINKILNNNSSNNTHTIRINMDDIVKDYSNNVNKLSENIEASVIKAMNILFGNEVPNSNDEKKSGDSQPFKNNSETSFVSIEDLYRQYCNERRSRFQNRDLSQLENDDNSNNYPEISGLYDTDRHPAIYHLANQENTDQEKSETEEAKDE